MSNKLRSGFVGVVAAIISVTSSDAQTSSESATKAAYFQTSLQTESQFIVEAITTDLAEQMYYAAKHRLPDKKHFSVTATEKAGSPADAPVYDLQINLDEQSAGLKLPLNVNGPIWSADVYRDVATALAKAVGLSATAANAKDDTALVTKLLDIKAEIIEREDLALSEALEKDFTNPKLHEQAALLLGGFVIRDSAGLFAEIRMPMSRMTAHLAMARFLGGGNPTGVCGQLADAIILTSVGNQTMALDHIKSLDASEPAVAGMVRALQAWLTSDYRPLNKITNRSQIEDYALYNTLAGGVGGFQAWLKLDAKQKQSIEYVRVANQLPYSVQMGHELLQETIPLEMAEIQKVYGLAQSGKELSPSLLVEALNQLPERCITAGPGQEVHVHVIGWGQWAEFLQRHLCNAVQANFDFLSRKWGVPDEAKQFAAECDAAFGGLHLYPFVRRFDCTDIASYRSAVDDAVKVIAATPQLVPEDCWNSISNNFRLAPPYPAKPNLHVNEWFVHDPPPGTVYNVYPRLGHPAFAGGSEAISRAEHLLAMSPYDMRIMDFIVDRKYKNRPTYEQAMSLYGTVLPWSPGAMRIVANTLFDKPARYEELMLQAARLNSAAYYDLGEYALRQNLVDKAAQYLDKACDQDIDAIRVADHAGWRSRYYLKKGDTEKARKIVDFAGEVYSWAGLSAKADFLDATTNYDGAHEWYAKIEERYNNASPLISYMLFHRGVTGDTRFDEELKGREKEVFPKGKQKVSLADFHDAPTDGAVFTQQSDLLAAAHMKKGDVVTAIQGVRVQTVLQYDYVRDFLTSPELDLVVWQGNAYHEIKTSPPKHLFGVDMRSYKPITPAGGL